MLALTTLAEQLGRYRFHISDEKQMQADMVKVLEQLQYRFYREHNLDTGIVDFWLPDPHIALECKVKGRPAEVERQLRRYAECRSVDGLLLLTSKAKHCSWQSEFLGKPFQRVWVGTNFY